jgi:AmiR/NasT family two-component response regulator
MILTTPSYETWNALILHPPHAIVEAITRQLVQIGINVETSWPDLPAGFDPCAFNIVFFDADMGCDDQFSWQAGDAPFPMIALIGSEAPGRVAWAIRQGADAHLLKPIGSGGIYSAVMIAAHAYEMRRMLSDKTEKISAWLEHRECLAEATAYLMVNRNISADAAYRELRLMAMSQRVPIEKMAAILLDQMLGTRKNYDRA